MGQARSAGNPIRCGTMGNEAKPGPAKCRGGGAEDSPYGSDMLTGSKGHDALDAGLGHLPPTTPTIGPFGLPPSVALFQYGRIVRSSWGQR